MGISRMSRAEKAERYRALAAEARRQAASTTSTDVRDAYLSIAVQWERLALTFGESPSNGDDQ
jgi:hypothetical protein